MRLAPIVLYAGRDRVRETPVRLGSNAAISPTAARGLTTGAIRGDIGEILKLVTAINAEALEDATLIAESNEFAIFDIGNDTYALVHRHAAVEWQAITISGDGLFRVLEILAGATRTLYRDVAGDLSKQRRL